MIEINQNEKVLTESESALFMHITRQRLSQLRTGFKQKKKNKTYFIKPKLIKGEDWYFSPCTGKIVIKEESLINLKSKIVYKKD